MNVSTEPEQDHNPVVHASTTIGVDPLSVKVINYTFNDVHDPEDWTPDDPLDFEEWVTVTVGDDKGGSNFQVHVCTPVSISGLETKKHAFMVDKWGGVSGLIDQLNAFVQKIESDPTVDVYHELSNHWMWEYAGM